MDQATLSKEIAKFNVADSVIAEMSSRYLMLKIEDGYEVVKKARIEVKNKRVEVEKKRKELKEDALRYGQAIDAEARRLTALLAPIEEHLEREERIYLDEKERERKEKERIAAEKLQAKIDRLCALGAQYNGTVFSAYGLQVAHKALEACSDEGFEQFIAQVVKAKEAEEARIRAEEEAKKAEAERLRKIAEEQEAERKRLAEIERAQKEEADRLRAAQEAIERERQRLIAEEAARLKAIEDEKRRVEEERLMAEMLERARQEAAAKAIQEAEEKAAREKAEEAERAERARIAAERQAARRPDKIKLLEQIEAVKAALIDVSGLKTKEAKDIQVEFDRMITTAVNYLGEKAGEL